MYVSVSPEISFPLELQDGYLRGLGATSSTGAILSAGGAAASVTAAGLAAAGIISAAAIPFIGPAIAGVTLAIEAILNSGCGETCIETSQWANEAEAQLQANIAAYFAQPAPRAQSLQTLALGNYTSIWNTLVSQCSQAGTGTAGQNCISDREPGACHYRQTATVPPYPNSPAYGACWNWYSAYYVPVAMDAAVPDASAIPVNSTGTNSTGTTTTATTGATETTTSSTPSLLLIAAAGLLLLGVAFS